MYIILKRGNEVYKSMCFGVIDKSKNKWEDRKDLIALSPDKTKLVLCNSFMSYEFVYLDYKDDFKDVTDKIRISKFLPDNIADLINADIVPEEITNRCVLEDSKIEDREFYDVTSYEDGDNLLWTVHGFHDAQIKEIKEYDDTIYVYFAGEWGCDVELWFEGEATCEVWEERMPGHDNRWWYDSKIVVKDGFIFFCDDEFGEPDEVDEDNVTTWFKARKLRYKVIV